MRRWLPLLLALTLITPLRAQDVRRGAAGTDYSYTILSKSATYTVVDTDGQNVLVLASNTITINLYAVSGNAGKTVTVKNAGAGTITIDANSTETIDGALTQTISAANQSLTLVCTGSAWVLI
ncbi:MAG: hypothetical protein EBU54_12760 [Mycobacteriaceae bacterium]|nr:hypothetical protein [Mycobacteriaceae bacterium]